MDLSIIIVNWNTKIYLEKCLTSLCANYPQCECDIWVVDNASTDDSVQFVREVFPQVHLIENEENFGFARANNQAILRSKARYVLLLNPDTVVLPGALQTLIDFIEKQTSVGAVGPMILNPDLSLQSSCNPMPTLWLEFWRLMYLDRLNPKSIYSEEKWDTSVAHPVEVIQGNCLLIRRDALSQVGLLDEAFFMFTEEIDLCNRLLQRGWTLYWVPMAKIIHYGGQSTRQVASEMFLELYRSKIVFFRKTRGSWGSVVYKLILFITALTRLPWGILRRKRVRQDNQRSFLYWNLLLKLPYL